MLEGWILLFVIANPNVSAHFPSYGGEYYVKDTCEAAGKEALKNMPLSGAAYICVRK